MIDRILDKYAEAAEHAVVVIHPTARQEVEPLVRGRRVTLAEQPQPIGMLDAILRGRDAALLMHPERIWITWCDQVGISASTISSITRLEQQFPHAAVILPTAPQSPPYIHLVHNSHGRLVDVLQRREGDAMPGSGMTDAGLFSLSRQAFADWLPEYARSATPGAATGELNFLPFLAWVAGRAPVVTFHIAADEARGINTPADLAAMEHWLA